MTRVSRDRSDYYGAVMLAMPQDGHQVITVQNSSHVPMLSQPGAVTGAIRGAANGI